MAYQIVFTEKARQSIADVIDYLENKWSEKVVTKFLKILDRHIQMIAAGIIGGTPSKTPNVKSVLVTKHNRLYYRIKVSVLQILLLWDTRQNPARHPFE